MATATAPEVAPFRTSREILDDVERDGERQIRYRWTHSGGVRVDGTPMEDMTGISSAWARIHRVSDEVMHDRWYGALHDESDPSDLQNRFDSVLTDLAEAVLRRPLEDETIVDGQPALLCNVILIDDLEGAVRDWILERARTHAR